MTASPVYAARRKCEKLGIDQNERVLLFCLDRKTAGCASAREMTRSWKYLKQRLSELKLKKKARVMPVKIGCIGICKSGPIMAVIPDGVWYGGCTPEVIEQILQEHLIDGSIVENHVISRCENW